MCKEKTRVSAAGSTVTPETIHEDAAMVDAVVDPLPSGASCLEKIRDLEVKEKGTLKRGAGGVGLIVSTTTRLASSDQEFFLLNLAHEEDLGPVTRILNGQIVEVSSLSDQMENGDFALGCQTPTESIFDPFASGPEEMVLAPKKKMLKETRIPLRRQLNFENDKDDEEHRLLESVHKSFLDLVISNQLREMSDKNLSAESNHPSEVFKTPTSLPILTGIAETYPAAPMRPGSNSRKLSDGVCRKLEFGTNLL